MGNKIILEKLQVNPKVIFKHADIKFNNKNFNNKIINIKTFKSFNLNLLKTKTKKIKFKEEKKKILFYIIHREQQENQKLYPIPIKLY